MTLHATQQHSGSDFSEIRDLERERTLAVIAASTVAATTCIIVAALIALGVVA